METFGLTELGNFLNILDAMDYRFPNLANRYWLFCGDNWLQWRAATATNENDDHEPKRTVGSFNNGSRCISTCLKRPRFPNHFDGHSRLNADV